MGCRSGSRSPLKGSREGSRRPFRAPIGMAPARQRQNHVQVLQGHETELQQQRTLDTEQMQQQRQPKRMWATELGRHDQQRQPQRPDQQGRRTLEKEVRVQVLQGVALGEQLDHELDDDEDDVDHDDDDDTVPSPTHSEIQEWLWMLEQHQPRTVPASARQLQRQDHDGQRTLEKPRPWPIGMKPPVPKSKVPIGRVPARQLQRQDHEGQQTLEKELTELQQQRTLDTEETDLRVQELQGQDLQPRPPALPPPWCLMPIGTKPPGLFGFARSARS